MKIYKKILPLSPLSSNWLADVTENPQPIHLLFIIVGADD
jgi:hypothetical protein